MSTLASVIGRGVNASRPAAGIAGQLYLSTDVGPGTFYRDNGSSWDAIGFVNPMTTAGDTITGGASGAPTRLAAGNAGGVLAMGNGAVIWNAGTSFPASKVTNDRYYRTDINGGTEFTWDGTRWVTVHIESVTQDFSTAITADWGYFSPQVTGFTDLWLVDFGMMYNVASSHTIANFYAVALHKYDNTTDATIVTITTDKSTTTWNAPASSAIGALVGLTNKMLFVHVVKTGTPGALTAGWTTRYRGVAT